MSLSFIKDIRPFPDYAEPGGDYFTGLYGDPEESLHRFAYSESRDQFVVAGMFEWWPFGVRTGWPANLYFNGETGAFEEGISAPWNYWQLYYQNMVWSQGSFGKVYSVGMSYAFSTYQIVEVDVDTRLPIINMTVPSNTWNPETYFSICSYCMERQEAIIVESNPFGTNEIEVWDCSNPLIPVQKSKLIPPGIVSNLCYENKELMWLVTTEGIIAKFNYELAYPRYEVLSSVQDPGGDTLAYRVAYDSKRKRVVVFRIRDDADGKNQSSIEFYRPYYVPSQITEPVPVKKVVGGQVTDFVGHLLGSAGEGVAAQTVIPSLSIGANGSLLTNVASTSLNGSFLVRYQVGNSLYTDELELSADIGEIFE